MKRPCQVSFNVFAPSFGAGLIHDRISLDMKDMQQSFSTCASRSNQTAHFNHGLRHQHHHRRQRPRVPPTTLTNPIHVFFLRDDIMCTRKKFPIVLEVYKLVDSDNEKVRAQCEECPNDGLKSNNNENVRVQKGYQKLRHLVIVGAAH